MTPEAQRSNFRAFLDGVQYSRTGILRYERIFGPGFVSTGGLETTKVRLTGHPVFVSPVTCQPVYIAALPAGGSASATGLPVTCEWLLGRLSNASMLCMAFIGARSQQMRQAHLCVS